MFMMHEINLNTISAADLSTLKDKKPLYFLSSSERATPISESDMCFRIRSAIIGDGAIVYFENLEGEA